MSDTEKDELSDQSFEKENWDSFSDEENNDVEFHEIPPLDELTSSSPKLGLNFPVNWELSFIRDQLRDKVPSDRALIEILTYYRSLKNLEKLREGGHDYNKLVAKNVIDYKINDIYKNFFETKIEPNVSIDFLGFLSNREFNKKFLINHYFDKIYILNLDRRSDRMTNMERRLKRWGIYNWVRLSAIDGSQSPHWEEWRHYTKSKMTRYEKVKYHRKAIGSPGSWAILKSMYHLIKDAQKKQYKRILVLQDDCLFHKKFREEFLKLPQYIPDKKWRLLYLGGTQHNWNHIIKSQKFYYPNGTTDGAFAVGIHSEIYDELIGEILKFEMPVDSGALRNLQKKYVYQSYVIYPNLIIADIRDSDLRQSRDLTNFGKRFKWDAKLYEIDK